MVTNTFTNGTVADATQVNANFTDIETSAMSLGAQNAYQTLQANNVFENKDFLFVDEFTDSNGTNNTVNTTTSTGAFNVNKYVLSINDLSSAGTTQDPNSFTTPANAFDNNDSTSANKAVVGVNSNTSTLGKTFTSQNITSIYIVATSTNALGAASANSVTIDLQSFDGTVWTTEQTLATKSLGSGFGGVSVAYNGVVTLNKTIQGLRINFTSTGGTDTTYTYDLFTLEYGDYNTSSTVICNTNTKTLDGNEGSICIYADKTTPTNTSITVDVSDGTTILSAQALNTVLDISSLSSGTLTLTFNLSTTDTTITPVLLGYGGSIL